MTEIEEQDGKLVSQTSSDADRLPHQVAPRSLIPEFYEKYFVDDRPRPVNKAMHN